jgi:hypothetical protein
MYVYRVIGEGNRIGMWCNINGSRPTLRTPFLYHVLHPPTSQENCELGAKRANAEENKEFTWFPPLYGRTKTLIKNLS